MILALIIGAIVGYFFGFGPGFLALVIVVLLRIGSTGNRPSRSF